VNTHRLKPRQTGWYLIYPGGMQGSVDIGGWTCTEMVYLSADSHPSSSNRAQCRATLLIKTNNVLTTTPRHHPCVDYNTSTCDTSVDMQQNNYQNITINFLEIPQGSHQAIKIKFPDISLTLQAGFATFQAKISF